MNFRMIETIEKLNAAIAAGRSDSIASVVPQRRADDLRIELNAMSSTEAVTPRMPWDQWTLPRHFGNGGVSC